MADCFVCDTSITLDNKSAACFLRNAPQYIENAAQSGRAEVNLDLCASRGLESFPSLGDPGQGSHPPVKTVYFLELENIQCVQRIIAANTDDKALTIDFADACKQP